MHTRSRTWPLSSDPVQRCRDRTGLIDSPDGSTLSLDFTTGVLDPRLTFTRTSNATFINSSGLVEWAAANILVRSNELSNTGSWSRTGIVAPTTSSSAPTGDAAWRLEESAGVAGTHSLAQSPASSQGIPYTFSILVKKDQRNWIVIQIASATFVYFDANAGVFGTTSGTLIGYDKSDVGDGWWRIYISANALASSLSCVVYLASANGTVSYTGVSGQGLFIASPQIEPGVVMRSYNQTGSAAYHAPRFDYDPTSIGTPRGLLIEGSASNLLKYSSYADTLWIAYGGYSKAYTTGITSPAGDTSAVRVTFDAVGKGLYTNNTQMGYTNSVGAAYTFSAWIRATSSTTNAKIRFGDSAVAIGPDIPISTTWTRYSYQYTAVANSGPSIQSASGTATGEFEMWGMQLEAGSGASSYIPTGASQGQRNADSCDCTSGNFSSWYTQGPGTLLVHARPFRQNYSDLASLCTSTSDPRLAIRTNDPPSAAGITLYGNNSGTVINIKTANSYSINNLLKTAVGLQQGNYAVVLNGGTVNSSVGTGTFPTALNRLTIGQPAAGGSEANAWISLIKYWPTRLPDAQLQSLTT